MPIAETVAGPAGIPVISPSATSPQLSTVPDNDFFFRTALSDAIQGPVLASLTRERGFDRSVALDMNQTTYLGESAGSGAQTVAGLWTAVFGIPVISPSATSPQLSTVPDNDFFFRTALSDAIQGRSWPIDADR